MPCAARTASSSQRSFSEWPACPFTHSNVTSCWAHKSSSLPHKSTLIALSFLLRHQPFADLAARRKDLEDRCGAIASRLDATGRTQKMAGSPRAQPITQELSKQALSDMPRVLSSDTLPGREKRDLLGGVISRVVCQPEGADVYYLPGVFPAASPLDNSTLMVCQVSNGICRWSVEGIGTPTA